MIISDLVKYNIPKVTTKKWIRIKLFFSQPITMESHQVSSKLVKKEKQFYSKPIFGCGNLFYSVLILKIVSFFTDLRINFVQPHQPIVVKQLKTKL